MRIVMVHQQDGILVSGGLDKTVLEINKTKAGWTSSRILFKLNCPVTSVALSPSASVLVVGGEDGSIQVVNRADTSQSRALCGPSPIPSAIICAAFDPQSEFLV